MRRHLTSIRALAVLVTMVWALYSKGLSAAEDLERARSTFRDALILEVAGDWAAALAKFQEVAKARLTPQVRYHLARCKENLGRLTEALGDYRVAETEARFANLDETGEMERARGDLEMRIPKLFLHLQADRVNTIVELDGIALGALALERPILVNPGWHRITLRHPSGATSDSFVDAQIGKVTEVNLNPHELTPAGVINEKPPSLPEPNGAPSKWAYVSAGIGAAGIVSSVVFWIVRSRAEQKLDATCRDGVCPLSVKGVEQQGQFASVAAPIALGVGMVGVGLAAWGFWSQPKVLNRRPSNTAAAKTVVAPGLWGVQIAAEF